MFKPKVSIIIPVRTETVYLKETISYLGKQSFNNFETIIITDKKEAIFGAKVFASGDPGPAYKRNLGSQIAKSQILAFLDDDSYPSKYWLEEAIGIFQESKEIAAVCGPCLTPPSDNIYQKASGWVWSSWFGSGGAGTYRNKISHRREVDDFPSVNLLVRKKDFQAVGGFDIQHWPGEDTKLCLGLTNKLGKKIVYDPRILVFHHRRPVLLPHLRQISRYGLRRGYFARKFPQTSLRLGYLLPSIFILGLFIGGLLTYFIPNLRIIYLVILISYLFLLVVSGIEVLFREKNLYLVFLVIIAIMSTHLLYGSLFIKGYFQENLGVIPHQIDQKKKKYIGG